MSFTDQCVITSSKTITLLLIEILWFCHKLQKYIVSIFEGDTPYELSFPCLKEDNCIMKIITWKY